MKNAMLESPGVLWLPGFSAVGGFHTEDMAALLRRQHRTFI